METPPEGKSSVPKFSSFRPKKPPVGTDAGKPKEDKETRPHRRSEDLVQRRRHHDPSSTGGKHRSHHSRPEPSRTPSKLDSPHTHVRESQDASYIIDRKGDPLNITYGGLDRRKVPEFVRRGAGRILGLHSRWKIDRAQSTERHLVIQSPYVNDFRGISSFRKEKQTFSKAQRLVLPSESDAKFDVGASYIPLGKKRKREFTISDEELNDFRLTEPSNKKLQQFMDSDADSEPASDDLLDYADPRERIAREKNAELIYGTRTEPQNLSIWLELLQHQEAMIRLGRQDLSTDLSGAEKRNLADVKISIYEEALSKILDDQDAQEMLWLDMLHEGAKVWEDKKLAQKWEQAVNKNPKSFKLRIKRLDYFQTTYSAFSTERCKSDYLDCLKTIGGAFNAESSPEKREKLIHLQVYVFLRLSCFLRDAGYHEQALALWQASLDFVIFRPPSISGQAALESFGEFWDSEVARLGEAKQSCWRSYLQQSDSSPPAPISIQEEQIHPSQDIFHDFVVAERRLEGTMCLPGRTIDDAGEDDPFHVILFSDISPVLSILIPDSLIRWPLIAGFLCYSGLPPLYSSSVPEKCLEWWDDPFVRAHVQDIWADKEKSTHHKLDILPASFKSRVMTTEFLFSDAFKIPPLVQKDWLYEVLNVLVEDNSDDKHFMEYFIAMQMEYRGAKLAAKSAKRFLKSYSTVLRLYNAYYILECRQAKVESADTVISTTVNMSRNFDEKDKSDVSLLWRTWIWQKFRGNQIEQAIHLLLSVDEQRVHPPASNSTSKVTLNASSLLKSRLWLRDGQKQALYTANPANFALFSELLMLLSYFEHSRSLQAARAAFNEGLSLLESYKISNTSFQELTQQALSSVASYHATHTKPYKPAEVRDILLQSIAAFPRNTTFLEAYANHEKSFGLNDRLRSNLPKLLDQDSVPTWLFAVWVEASRSSEAGGTIHSIRSMFERAVQSKSGTHSIALWTLYLQFEIFLGQTQKIKDVLLRGMTKLPWVKSLIISGLSALTGKVGLKELRNIHRVMEDRELRTHVNLIDVFEEMGLE